MMKQQKRHSVVDVFVMTVIGQLDPLHSNIHLQQFACPALYQLGQWDACSMKLSTWTKDLTGS
jgi:hypothetical protein